MTPLCNVLIVEDEYLIALDLIETMVGFGAMRTEMALDNLSASGLIDSQVFDLVTLDYFLGRDTCQPLVERLRHRNIPFIVVTGLDLRLLPPWLSGSPVLPKPINYREVGEAVQALGFVVAAAA